MKTKVRRRKRLQFPAAGVQSDIETLLQKFVDSKSIRYEEFARLWREGNFSLLCAGRTGLREKREFIEETFKIVLKFVLSPYSLQVRVGALFALYGIYYTQRTKPKIKVRMPLSCWCDVMELHQEVVSHRHLDIDYIIRKMIHEGVFEHVAYPSPLTVEDFYNKDDDDDDDSFVEETEINNTWQKEVNLVSELLDEDSLGQLNAVHSKYHQLKCHLNATRGGDPNQPSTSLDLIQGDVVDTIIRVAQQTEISVTSPHRSKAKSPRAKASAASSEESASERATRIKEIKKRASQARANTDSGSLSVRVPYLVNSLTFAVMTSCGEDASVLPFATSHWSALKREDISPTYPQFPPAYLSKHDLMKTQQELQNMGTNGDTDNAAMAAVLRQRLEMYWSQICQYQQQKSNGLKIKDEPQHHVTAAQVATSQQGNVDGVKEIMQRLIADKAKALPYGCQLPWSSLVAMAANRQAGGVDASNPPPLPTTDQDNPNIVNPGLGNLLPPPPLLPMISMFSPHSVASLVSSSPSIAHNTTSTAVHRPRALINVDQKITSFPFAPTQNTSNTDKNQPLDLRTSSKRQRSDDSDTTTNSENEIRGLFFAKPILQSTPQKKPQPTSYPPVTNGLVSSPPIYPQAVNPSQALASLSPQQLAALAPYLQNNPAPALQALYGQNAQQFQNGSPASASPLNQEYLQKWLMAAQQHQHVAAMQQPAKKRQRMDDFAQQQNNKRLSFHAYNMPNKDMRMVNGIPNSPHASSPPSNQTRAPTSANGGSGKRYKRYAKPPYSYVSLITLSILSSPEKKLRLSQILKRISEMFPFFNGSYQGWRDSVRHNLSQNECFIKVLKNPFRPTAKGNYWTVNITAIPHELLLRQNTLVSRYAQDSGFRYRKDLTEVFDLINGNVKVHIPRHLLSGVDLVDDPAAIMEALLLEEKTEDDVISPNVHSNARVYSLVDMFNQDDFIEEDLLRQHQQVGGNRWSGKNRSRANASAKNAVQIQQQPFATPPYPQYINSIESQKLAIQMIQSSSPALSNPTKSQILAKALSGQISNFNCLPLLQSYYANAQQAQATAKQDTGPEQQAETAPQGDSKPPVQAEPAPKVHSPISECSSNDDPLANDIGLNEWNQANAKRSRRKGLQPVRRTSSNDGDNKEDNNRMPPSPQESSAVDSGILGSMSPRSPTRSLCSSEADVSSGPLVIDQASPVRSQSSDVSTETMASSPRDVPDDVMRVFAQPFGMFNARAVETGKMM